MMKLHHVQPLSRSREEQCTEATHSYTAMAIHAIRTSTEKVLSELIAFQGLPRSNKSDMFKIRIVERPISVGGGKGRRGEAAPATRWGDLAYTASVDVVSNNLGLVT